MNFPKDLRVCLSTFVNGTTRLDMLRESIRRALLSTGYGILNMSLGNNELMLEWDFRKADGVYWMTDQISLSTFGTDGEYGSVFIDMTGYPGATAVDIDEEIDEVLHQMDITEAGWEVLRWTATAAYIDRCETTVAEHSSTGGPVTLALAPTEMRPWIFDPATIINHEFTV